MNEEKVYCKKCRYFSHSILAIFVGPDETTWEICKYRTEFQDFYDKSRKRFVYAINRNKDNNCKLFELKEGLK